jgi:hypothetical protein
MNDRAIESEFNDGLRSVDRIDLALQILSAFLTRSRGA